MKNSVKTAAMAGLMGAFLLAGCAGTKPISGLPTSGAPKWVADPTVEGSVSEVGVAPKSAAGIQMQRTEALANARDELARKMEILVKNSFQKFQQTTGVGDAQTVDKVTKDVSKQLAKQTLSGSKQKDLWLNPSTGDLYVLVVIDAKEAAAAAKTAARTSLKNDQALWQMFQSQKAQEELDRDIEKEFGAGAR